MTGAIHPADGLAAALMFIARNPEAAASVVVRAEPSGPAGESAESGSGDISVTDDEPRGLLSVYETERHQFGARLNTVTKYTRITPGANTLAQLVGRDPRRIRIEIVVSSTAASTQQAFVGPLAAMQANQSLPVALTLSGLTVILVRDSSTDGDSVSEDIWVQGNNASMVFAARETLLTPLAVDKLCD